MKLEYHIKASYTTDTCSGPVQGEFGGIVYVVDYHTYWFLRGILQDVVGVVLILCQ